MSYPLIISDINKRSQRIKSLLKKKLNKIKIKNLIIVIGGDGFMLSALKKYRNYKKLFYGINSGNYGFLMNKFSKNFSAKNLSKCRNVTISPLEMTLHIIGN